MTLGPRILVVKLGSGVIVDEQGVMAVDAIASLAASVARARACGCEVVLVTSGAVAVGARRLADNPLPTLPGRTPACAAVGQAHLMVLYSAIFSGYGIEIGQVLLTEEDVADPERLAHVAQVVRELTASGVLPILNENDVVVSGEALGGRSRRLHDNDHLAAFVASRLAADLLILLSVVDGLLRSRPGVTIGERVEIIPRVDARAIPSTLVWRDAGWGRGGMESKLAAASYAAACGTTVIIANGRTPRIIDRILAGERVGTWVTREATGG